MFWEHCKINMVDLKKSTKFSQNFESSPLPRENPRSAPAPLSPKETALGRMLTWYLSFFTLFTNCDQCSAGSGKSTFICLTLFLYAPKTSCEVERLFSLLKQKLDSCQNILMKNAPKYLFMRL